MPLLVRRGIEVSGAPAHRWVRAPERLTERPSAELLGSYQGVLDSVRDVIEARRPLLAEQLLLLSVGRELDEHPVPWENLNCAVIGSLVADLVDRGRVVVRFSSDVGDQTIAIGDHRATGDDVLDDALRVLHGDRVATVDIGVQPQAPDFGIQRAACVAARERLRAVALDDAPPRDACAHYVAAMCGGFWESGWLRDALCDTGDERGALRRRGERLLEDDPLARAVTLVLGRFEALRPSR